MKDFAWKEDLGGDWGHEGRAGEAPAGEGLTLDDVPEGVGGQGDEAADWGALGRGSVGAWERRDVNGLVLVVQGEDEEFAAEAAPGDEHFPEEGAVHGGVRVVEEINDGAVFDQVLAEGAAERGVPED